MVYCMIQWHAMRWLTTAHIMFLYMPEAPFFCVLIWKNLSLKCCVWVRWVHSWGDCMAQNHQWLGICLGHNKLRSPRVKTTTHMVNIFTGDPNDVPDFTIIKFEDDIEVGECWLHTCTRDTRSLCARKKLIEEDVTKRACELLRVWDEYQTTACSL